MYLNKIFVNEWPRWPLRLPEKISATTGLLAGVLASDGFGFPTSPIVVDKDGLQASGKGFEGRRLKAEGCERFVHRADDMQSRPPGLSDDLKHTR
jgi:hypothetical protein